MKRTTRNVRAVIVLILAVGATLGLGTTRASASPSRIDVYGAWNQEVGCLATTYVPDPASPTKATFTCLGTTTYEGGWTGQEVVHAAGEIDLVTGDSTGTGDATVTGTYLGDDAPSPGRLYIRDVFVLDGKTGGFHVQGRIVGGDGAFAGSSGCVNYDGVLVAGDSGHGGYSAIWFRGEPKGSAIVENACSAARRHPPVTRRSGQRSPVILRGGLFDIIPCAPTTSSGYTPNPGQPTRGTFDCRGSAGFDGALQGAAVYHATGTIDLTTNDLSGVVDVTFTGTYTGDDSHPVGTLHWFETFTFDGRTSAQHWEARIRGGTGDFAGSSGCAVGNSFEVGGAEGQGGYAGIWFRTPPDPAAVEKACSSDVRDKALGRQHDSPADRSTGQSHRDVVAAATSRGANADLASPSGVFTSARGGTVGAAHMSLAAQAVSHRSRARSVLLLVSLGVAAFPTLIQVARRRRPRSLALGT